MCSYGFIIISVVFCHSAIHCKAVSDMLEAINFKVKQLQHRLCIEITRQIRPVSFIFLDRSKTIDNTFWIDYQGKSERLPVSLNSLELRKKKRNTDKIKSLVFVQRHKTQPIYHLKIICPLFCQYFEKFDL